MQFLLVLVSRILTHHGIFVMRVSIRWKKGRTFYTSNAGLKELKIEISNFLNRKYGLDYDYNHEIMVTVGGSEAIDIAMRAMLDPGDEVLIPQPSYVSYLPCARLAGGVPVIIELKDRKSVPTDQR